MAAVSERLIKTPRNANIFSTGGVSFHRSKITLACKTCVNDNSSDKRGLVEESARAESAVSTLWLML